MKNFFPLHFILSKKAAKRYELDDFLQKCFDGAFSSDPRAYRVLGDIVNKKRHVERYPYQAVRAGYLQSIGLVNEIYNYIIWTYVQKKQPGSAEKAYEEAVKKLGKDTIRQAMVCFVEHFPPLFSYKEGLDVQDFIDGDTDGIANKFVIWEKMKVLQLANENPAFFHYQEFFNELDLVRITPSYKKFIDRTNKFFKKQVGYGPKNNPLPLLLREPIVESPNSLTGQLLYMKDHWGSILSSELMLKLLLVLDIITEEDKQWGLGAGEALVPEFGRWRDGEWESYGDYLEEERFSSDLDWMPRVVMLAKSTYVWLDQLSKKYRRSITRLDQIPDEELDLLARWGFTGLWLIGLWERSSASQKIKQISGNPDAISSAYSLYDYNIAHDLGGDEAYQNLKYRAWVRRIRLASDMVPNHMGIYSQWVIEHPDWFLSLDYSPYPAYSFNGPNLSDDDRVGIYIEDGYWDKRDAAVVFKRVDHWTGNEKYIYHGNDGTSMPWNDTAQLNFLVPEVREAVVQTILHVARKFPIIRFDAAMTLAKKHYQRLWFPQPGSGGSIPSRSEYGMTREEFDKVFPKEFWREVVDRVAKEVPDTLLLAEAFWLMEGYFVRTLGMHRVYNSAFMNMLKMEENEKYRNVVKNVLEFDPRILQRFVNFMNNPDELTAIQQFGKDDKYFGVCLMMVTMPGLPMFGHGQVEGYTEKYGMEYKRAYWNEEVDWDLVRRHEAEIFPLMRKRHLFSGAENFVLFDFFTGSGAVDENVFAYSNRCGNERALVIYHNTYATTRGWIRSSSSLLDISSGKDKNLIQKNLAEALQLKTDGKYYYIFRDYKTGLEYIRHGKDMADNGLFVELDAYQFHAFLDFREVEEDAYGNYYRLMSLLGGRGVPNIDEALREMILSPLLASFRHIMNPAYLDKFSLLCQGGLNTARADVLMENTNKYLKDFFMQINNFTGSKTKPESLLSSTSSELSFLAHMKKKAGLPFTSTSKAGKYISSRFPVNATHAPRFWTIPLSWSIIREVDSLDAREPVQDSSVSLMEEFLLKKTLYQSFFQMLSHHDNAFHYAELVKILVKYQEILLEKTDALRTEAVEKMLKDGEVKQFLNVHWHDGILWFRKESFEDLMYWMFFTYIIRRFALAPKNMDAAKKESMTVFKTIDVLLVKAAKSGYRLEEFEKLL